ncbi:MAG: exodeoxyribonuclease III [Candidatus Hydrogenedentota bacterium]|nr:MAG: exodeoxyribonuclease III [Candidatus Hydrogenedentota bacterium]
MITLYSWNVNGIRAVERKGALDEFLQKYNPDILFLQETKARKEQLSEMLTDHPEYYQYYHSAEKKGYSGVSVWLKKSVIPQDHFVSTGMDGWNDHEGRVIRVDIGQYTFFGVYFPNGGKSEEAWKEKLVFYDHFLDHINTLRKKRRKIIWTGDLNVAHTEIDLARPKENQNSIGFLPEERSWVDRVIQKNWVDCFRYFHPDKISYTWWQMQTRARERNVGWRIDYFFVDKKLLPEIIDCDHLNEQMGSDHCPIFLKTKLSF